MKIFEICSRPAMPLQLFAKCRYETFAICIRLVMCRLSSSNRPIKSRLQICSRRAMFALQIAYQMQCRCRDSNKENAAQDELRTFKTISGSSRICPLFNHTRYSPSQSRETVPLTQGGWVWLLKNYCLPFVTMAF
jgi:hypothetical protein